jgi:tetratricopeptide (TPR) repeat protein
MEQKAPPAELANHYAEAGDLEKAVEYLLKAGDHARGLYAYQESIAAYLRALAFLSEMGDHEQTRVLEWKASAQFVLGKLYRFRGEFVTALEWLAGAKEACAKLEDTAGLAQVLIETGIALHHKGEYAQVREVLNAGLALAREAGDTRSVALALLVLGKGVTDIQVDYAAARALYEESLSLYREMDDKAGISDLLNELGNMALYQGNYAAARALHEESLSLRREMGNKQGIANSFLNLGMGAKAGISISLANLALVEWAQGNTTAARELLEECLGLEREIGDKAGIPGSLIILALVALVQGNTTEARELLEESLTWIEKIDENLIMAYFLLGLGLVDLAENNPEARGHIFHSLRLGVKMGVKVTQTSSLVGLARLALQAGDARGAAQWLGAVESALKALGVVMEPEVIHFHAQTLAAVREQLGESAFQSAWVEGAGWSLEEAVALALKEN